VLLLFASSGQATGPPVNVRLPEVLGATGVGQTLTVDVGGWLRASSFSYVWKRDGVAISGANAATYTLTLADSGAMISCTVTATNAFGDASETSAAVGPVVEAGIGFMAIGTTFEVA
jgi:hypothetical protein